MRTRTTLLALAATVLSMGPSSAWAAQSTTGAVSQENRKDAVKHYQAGMERMQAESFAEAAEEFETAIKLDRLLVLAHYQLGEARMALKEYPQAVEALEDASPSTRS